MDGDYRDYLLGATAHYNKMSLKQREQLDGYRRDDQMERKREKVGRNPESTQGEGAFDDPVAPI